jgi:hypothetical protein
MAWWWSAPASARHHRNLVNGGFEDPASGAWRFSSARGSEFPVAQDQAPARSGETSKVLVVGPVAAPETVDWAAWSQRIPCQPNERIHAAVYVRVDDLAENLETLECYLEVRLDFFSDLHGENPLPARAGISTPFVPHASGQTGVWERIEVIQRAPHHTQSARISIVAWMKGEAIGSQTFWLDDATLKRLPALRRERDLCTPDDP